jgi:hypothetical protein
MARCKVVVLTPSGLVIFIPRIPVGAVDKTFTVSVALVELLTANDLTCTPAGNGVIDAVMPD